MGAKLPSAREAGLPRENDGEVVAAVLEDP